MSQYCAVIIPEGHEAYLETFQSPDDMVTALRKLYGSDSYAFPFYGVPWHITLSRHLVSDLGAKYPLFSEEELRMEPDPTGSLRARP